jgi:hypothetical protein
MKTHPISCSFTKIISTTQVFPAMTIHRNPAFEATRRSYTRPSIRTKKAIARYDTDLRIEVVANKKKIFKAKCLDDPFLTAVATMSGSDTPRMRFLIKTTKIRMRPQTTYRRQWPCLLLRTMYSLTRGRLPAATCRSDPPIGQTGM